MSVERCFGFASLCTQSLGLLCGLVLRLHLSMVSWGIAERSLHSATTIIAPTSILWSKTVFPTFFSGHPFSPILSDVVSKKPPSIKSM